jgi:hypothetical protein
LIKYQENDGGRRQAGWKGKNAGDCVPRAIAIALNLHYRFVRTELDRLTKEMTGGFETTTNNGAYPPVYHRFLLKRGWLPVLTKNTYLKDIPPAGTHIAIMSGHVATLIDGTLNDAWDSRTCRRTQCGSPKLMGYYTQPDTEHLS